jgi:hypothetical protein
MLARDAVNLPNSWDKESHILVVLLCATSVSSVSLWLTSSQG